MKLILNAGSDYVNNTYLFNISSEKRESTISISNETVHAGETTNITAEFYTEDGSPVNGGKAIFRINGRTLRDDQGKVIYVDVTNGIAVLKDATISKSWITDETTLQAIYTGNEEIAPIVTKPITENIIKMGANITMNSPQSAKPGDNITLSATVTDGDKNLNSGRVIFKLNGKTLKDKDGKVLYVNVENGIATTTYTLPAKTKAKTVHLNSSIH